MANKIVMMRPAELIPYENNPRINDKAVEAVAASIKEFGFKVPIVVDRNNVIICGHTRKLAAEQLDLEEVPVIIADDLTEEQAKAFRLADNKTGELAEWNQELLLEELAEQTETNMRQFGFLLNSFDEWDDGREKFDTSREEGNDEYNEFLDKFEDKKTTDDCYTPSNIYDVVCDYVEEITSIKRSKFIRPFYPGGNYKAEKYEKGKLVVDNPPFSILAEIVKFYVERGVPFFLFAPSQSVLNLTRIDGVAAVVADCQITYENGASVMTSFLTNLLGNSLIAKSEPHLNERVKKANKENMRKIHKEIAKLEYPVHVITAAKIGYMSMHQTEYELKRNQAEFIRAVGEGNEKTQIFGSGYLLSEKAATEKAAAEKAATEKAAAEKAATEKAAAEKAAARVIRLSKEELEIVKKLGEKDV